MRLPKCLEWSAVRGQTDRRSDGIRHARRQAADRDLVGKGDPAARLTTDLEIKLEASCGTREASRAALARS